MRAADTGCVEVTRTSTAGAPRLSRMRSRGTPDHGSLAVIAKSLSGQGGYPLLRGRDALARQPVGSGERCHAALVRQREDLGQRVSDVLDQHPRVIFAR